MERLDILPPTILVVFGITGDLSHRYLLPALDQVCKAKSLPADFKIIGISRREVAAEQIFKANSSTLKQHSQMFKMDMSQSDDYEKLREKLEQVASKMKQPPQIIFYLAIPPSGTSSVIKHLGQAKLNNKDSKLLLEKPFGTDYGSASDLIAQAAKYFKEEQVYRIDHYLAKEMAQNITVFLGSNGILRGIWNNHFIENIEIEVSEKIDIEGRVAFYEGTGALRDVGQSHLMQLAALTLMEPCSDIFDFDEIPRRRLAALKSLQPPAPDEIDTKVTRAQYEGYDKEAGNPGSQTETFFDITLSSNDPRWYGVPIRLVSGKALNEKLTEIRVNFRKINSSSSDLLIMRVQPREGIELYLWVKQPGYERRLKKLPLSFEYGQHFTRLPDAYEQVLIDAMESNHSLFASSAEVLESWRILQPIFDHWNMGKSELKKYKKGSTLTDVLS